MAEAKETADSATADGATADSATAKAKKTVEGTREIDISFEYLVLNTGYAVRTMAHWLDEGGVYTLTYASFNDAKVYEEKKTATLQRYTSNGEAALNELYTTRDYYGDPNYDDLDDNGDEVRLPHLPICVSSSLHGEGIYVRIGAENEAKLVLDAIHSCAKVTVNPKYRHPAATTDGMLVFECKDWPKALQIAENIAELRFCGGNLKTPCNIRVLQASNGKKMLLMEFDTESG